jgi:hypothetical protein
MYLYGGIYIHIHIPITISHPANAPVGNTIHQTAAAVSFTGGNKLLAVTEYVYSKTKRVDSSTHFKLHMSSLASASPLSCLHCYVTLRETTLARIRSDPAKKQPFHPVDAGYITLFFHIS